MPNILDGVNKQRSISDRIPLPVDIVADSAYVNSITGESVALYYFANAYLTCGTAGSATFGDYVTLAATGKFSITLNGQTIIVNPDFTGDTSMNDVATSIQTAIRLQIAGVTVAWSTDHFVITAAQYVTDVPANLQFKGNSITVLSAPSDGSIDLAGASWLNGKYGTGVVTKAVLTADAGQAAGTVVMGKLAYTGVLDQFGAMLGNAQDTSLVWTTGTVLPQKYRKECLKYKIEDVSNLELVDIALDICEAFTTNGEWCLDHRNGIIYGKKATTGTGDTVAYKIMSTSTGGGTTVIASQNLEKINNVDIPLDDAAFTPATSPVIPVGYFADETSPDSVTEGDIGAARMTLDRKQISANQLVDDAAFGVGTGYVGVIGGLADETATDSVDEGDIGAVRMTANRRLHVSVDGDIPATLTGGSKTVAVSGTAEAIGASLAIKSIYIRAKATNTSFVCIGDSSVDESTSPQITLYANDAVTLDIANRATVYVDADVSTEGIDYLCMI